MYLRDLYASLQRRWYLVVLGALLTVSLAFVVYFQAPVKYEATGSVALVPPATAVISGDNPFLYMGGLEQALGILTAKLNSDVAQRDIVGKYDAVQYSTNRDPSTNGPIVLVTVTGATAGETLGALTDVLAAVPQNLNSLQDSLNLTENSKITSMPLSSDEEAIIDSSIRTRTVLALAAGGVAGTLLLTGQLDKILLRRRAGKGTGRSGAQSRNGKGPEDSGSDASAEKNTNRSAFRRARRHTDPGLAPSHEAASEDPGRDADTAPRSRVPERTHAQTR
ncbi:hypothetical protein J2W14_000182 [Pseudarthrobacter oxydans]|uniref:hypothetical protein n=1 Tax=Pseudarthrobacter oxydans TaxID=1671 RepID=UPI00278A434B|nr:hypothetical protein [Pseudarthrobacter oxydans]MDP9980806.1 hypothetical protein [Pseudarthrobacter oxydans]